MTAFIQWHSDIKLADRVTPTGRPFGGDEDNLAAGVLFDRDLSVLFPYINAVISRAVYLAGPAFIRFRFEKILCALHPFYAAAHPVADRVRAEGFFARLIGFLNDLHARRADIRPNHNTYSPVSVLDLVRLLPRTNCRECGYPTCMAFAGAIRLGRAVARQCPDLPEPIMEKAVYPIYDEKGHVSRTIALDIDSRGALRELVRQKKTIAALKRRLAAVEDRAAAKTIAHTPPFGQALTRREIQVLRLAARGATNTEMSALLGISPHTVKSHMINIFNKLGVNDRTQAGVWAARNGLL